MREIFKSPAGKSILWMIARSFNTALVAVLLPFVLVRYLPTTKFSSWVLIVSIAAWFQIFETTITSGVARLVGGTQDKEGAALVVTSATRLLKRPVSVATGLIVVFILFFSNRYLKQGGTLDEKLSLAVVAAGASASAVLSPAIGYWSAKLNGKLLAKASLIIKPCQLLFAIGSALISKQLIPIAISYSIPSVIGSVYLWKQVSAHTKRKSDGASVKLLQQKLLEHTKGAAFWIIPGLFISGFDTVLVAQFDADLVGTYALALALSGLITVIHSAVLGPGVARVSSIYDRPLEIGEWVVKTSARFNTLMAAVAAAAILLSPLTRLFIPTLRTKSEFQKILILLVVANFLRILTAPYSTALLGSGGHLQVKATPSLEAVINLSVSVLLGIRFGAYGVAMGTIAGSISSIVLHLLVNMKRVSHVKLSRLRLVNRAFIPQILLVGLSPVALTVLNGLP